MAGWAAPLLEIPSRLIPTSLRFLLLWLSRAAIAGLGVGPSPHLGLPGSPRLGPWLQAHTGEADPPPLSRKHRLYAGACSALRPPRRGDVPSLRAQSGLSSSHRSLVRIERLVAARSRVAGTATHPSQQLLSYWPPQALFLCLSRPPSHPSAFSLLPCFEIADSCITLRNETHTHGLRPDLWVYLLVYLFIKTEVLFWASMRYP